MDEALIMLYSTLSAPSFRALWVRSVDACVDATQTLILDSIINSFLRKGGLI